MCCLKPTGRSGQLGHRRGVLRGLLEQRDRLAYRTRGRGPEIAKEVIGVVVAVGHEQAGEDEILELVAKEAMHRQARSVCVCDRDVEELTPAAGARRGEIHAHVEPQGRDQPVAEQESKSLLGDDPRDVYEQVGGIVEPDHSQGFGGSRH